MQEMNQYQITQVAGGVVLAPYNKDPNIYFLIVGENESFYYIDAATDTSYFFSSRGIIIRNDDYIDSSVFDPFFIETGSCVYSIPVNFFRIGV